MSLIHIGYFILAILGLGFLIFIHELGHYFVAKREGMKIQVFSIGFGKPFYSWKRGSVKWQLCFFLLGGYVKIAGMQKEGRTPAHKVKGGYYSKTCAARIKVAFAGPLVNIAFALGIFALIWAIGGRHKPFGEYTQIIGLIDPHSSLYETGVRSGDRIATFANRPYHGMRSMQYSMVETPSLALSVGGEHINYFTKTITPFQTQVTPYPNPYFSDQDIYTVGIFAPANYLFYDQDLVQKNAPIYKSGIERGDRVIWADGKLVFSQSELVQIINQNRALLAVKRGNASMLMRVPKLRASQIQNAAFQAELSDWEYAANLHRDGKDAVFIPYALTAKGFVQAALSYIDENAHEKQRWDDPDALRPGDQILTVDGLPFQTGAELFLLMQEKHVQIIVQRGLSQKPIHWQREDDRFIASTAGPSLSALIDRFASGNSGSVDAYHLLKPIKAVPYEAFPLPAAQHEKREKRLQKEQELVLEIKNKERRNEAEKVLRAYRSRLMIGLPLVDQEVIYNPLPWQLFMDTFYDIGRTLSGLVSGSISPKYVSGPVGIVTILQKSWGLGLAEALYWLAVISLNLGILNLLPIPPFDGGHILLSLYEAGTGKRINQKMMDRIVIVFVILLIGLALYVTFQDVIRLLTI